MSDAAILRPRRRGRFLIILGLVAFLVLSGLNFSEGPPSFGTPAQAGNCVTKHAEWKFKQGEVVWVGSERLSVTVCKNSKGQITSASPQLSGGTNGSGDITGFKWENHGAWVSRQSSTFVVVEGRAKLRQCIAKITPICGPTDTHRLVLKYSSTTGPYPTHSRPGAWAFSKACGSFVKLRPGWCGPLSRFQLLSKNTRM
jgi:hypothetical protein